MNNYYLKMLIGIILFSSALCGCKKDEKLHTATVIILSGSNPGINTCGWIVKVGELGNTLATPQNSFKPLNLEQQYQIDGNRVNITYTIPHLPGVTCGSNTDDLPGYTQINILNVQQLN
jgi:hypothetical protein